MKTSIALSFLILAISALFGWHNHQHLASIRKTHRTLVKQAAELGIDPRAATAGEPKRGTNRKRVDREAAARRSREPVHRLRPRSRCPEGREHPPRRR